jgi:hypothetical protein
MIFMIIQNPLLSQINIYNKSSELTVSDPNIKYGLTLQIPLIVDSSITSNLTLYNSTSVVTNQGFNIVIQIFNLGSLFVLLSPLIIYIYFEYNKNNKIINKKLKKKKLGV